MRRVQCGIVELCWTAAENCSCGAWWATGGGVRRRGKLARWTKGFDICDGVGSDPAESLAAALRQRGWRGRISALLNDGIGIFGAGRYQHPCTTVTMILGTGVPLPPSPNRHL